MKRLSLEQKIFDFLHDNKLSVVSLSFYGGKYTAIYTNDTYTYSAKSKSIARAISELYKFSKPKRAKNTNPLTK